ncbi:MAG: hypothetical protein Q8L51_01405 [Candidatus Amesbacteria bacterium]|nr:hypothetical protein [Candidatus Amesbacteria bacterium]
MEGKLSPASAPEDQKRKLGDLLKEAGAPPGTETKFVGVFDPKYLGKLDKRKVEEILVQAAAEGQPSTPGK